MTTDRRCREESGFTLVELLVVMLIIGLLAAIAIPSFFNQRDKARDADAKTLVRTAQTALETYAIDNNGNYAGVTVDALQAIEPVLEDVPDSNLRVRAFEDSDRYRLRITSATGNQFSIIRNEEGGSRYRCTTEGVGGCPVGGSWSS